jgi:hypothetical protein
MEINFDYGRIDPPPPPRDEDEDFATFLDESQAVLDGYKEKELGGSGIECFDGDPCDNISHDCNNCKWMNGDLLE